jgi:hypothetical protein
MPTRSGVKVNFQSMKAKKGVEFCVVVTGPYVSEAEARHALQDPFIEDWVEEKGRFNSQPGRNATHTRGDVGFPGSVDD